MYGRKKVGKVRTCSSRELLSSLLQETFGWKFWKREFNLERLNASPDPGFKKSYYFGRFFVALYFPNPLTDFIMRFRPILIMKSSLVLMTKKRTIVTTMLQRHPSPVPPDYRNSTYHVNPSSSHKVGPVALTRKWMLVLLPKKRASLARLPQHPFHPAHPP